MYKLFFDFFLPKIKFFVSYLGWWSSKLLKTIAKSKKWVNRKTCSLAAQGNISKSLYFDDSSGDNENLEGKFRVSHTFDELDTVK